MALSKASLKGRIISELQALSVVLGISILDSNQMQKYAEAMANAIIDEITANGEVVVPSGSSAGTYPVT